MSWYLIPDGTVVYHTRKRRGEWKRRRKRSSSKNSYLGKKIECFIILYHSFCRRCFLLFLTLREKRLSWKNHSRNPFVFLSFIFEFISLRGPYRRLEPTGREFPRSSCARGIHSVVAAKEFLIYVGLKHTHTSNKKRMFFTRWTQLSPLILSSLFLLWNDYLIFMKGITQWHHHQI